MCYNSKIWWICRDAWVKASLCWLDNNLVNWLATLSRFNFLALSSAAKFITSSKDVKRNNSNILKIPEINIEVGQEYIEYLLDLEIVSNNLIFLAAAYNGGPGNLKKWKEETNYLDDPLFFMESIPSRETRWFIEKILTKYWIYQNKNKKNMTTLKMLANGKDPLY